MTVPHLPLTGVRVVELTHVAAGPFTGMLLADLGADVVKVEPPTGDQMRAWPPLEYDEHGNSFSHNFASVNRNKSSVIADLKNDADMEMTRSLISAADVLIENYRPGVLDRLGLGFDEVTREHPGLVYCSISGFGLSSPYVNRGAYDVVIQGMSGLMDVTGEPDRPPVKSGVPVGDFVAGLYAAYVITAMLPGVRSSGDSVHLDCPMLDCLISIAALQTSEYWGTGRTPQRLGSAHPRNAPYRAFEASDGYFTIAAGNDKLFRQVCEVLELPGLADDSRYQSQELRARHQDELFEAIAPVLRTRTAQDWIARLDARGVPCGPVNTVAEILADEHVRATELVQEITLPIIGTTKSVGFPVRVSGAAKVDPRPAPMLGVDRSDVLRRWGVDPDA